MNIHEVFTNLSKLIYKVLYGTIIYHTSWTLKNGLTYQSFILTDAFVYMLCVIMCEQISTSVLLVKLFAMLDLQSLNFVLHFVVFTSNKIKSSLLYTCKGENCS